MILATAVGFALRLYQLLRPGFLLGVTEYDDGVYFGSAVRLVDGVIPYRDFAMVQPPGISVLMAPVAFLAKATGTDVGLAIARLLTVCAATVSITLTGLLVRHRGVLAATLACGILAVSPVGLNAAHTLQLEPWLVLFCLVGALGVFDGDHVAKGTSRLAGGGVAFGLAAAIKLWAALPVLALLALCWRPTDWRPRFIYLGGAVAGFCVAVLPFVALAPRAFFDSVVAAQLSRVDVINPADWVRLSSLTGVPGLLAAGRTATLAVWLGIGGFVAGCVLGASLLTRRMPPSLERFALGSAGLILVAFLWPPDYSWHYGWFFAPFFALSVALPATRLLAVKVSPSARRSATSGLGVRVLAPLSVAIVLALMAAYEGHQLAGQTGSDPVSAAHHQIPPGACVLTDLPSLTVVSDRFVSNAPGCSPMVDPVGTDYALSGGRNGVTGAGGTRAVQVAWLAAFEHAQYVWLTCMPGSSPHCGASRRIPWTPAIRSYFSRHFLPARAPGHLRNFFYRKGLHAHSA